MSSQNSSQYSHAQIDAAKLRRMLQWFGIDYTAYTAARKANDRAAMDTYEKNPIVLALAPLKWEIM